MSAEDGAFNKNMDLPSSVIKKFVLDYPMRTFTALVLFLIFMYCVIAPQQASSMAAYTVIAVAAVVLCCAVIGSAFATWNMFTPIVNFLTPAYPRHDEQLGAATTAIILISLLAFTIFLFTWIFEPNDNLKWTWFSLMITFGVLLFGGVAFRIGLDLTKALFIILNTLGFISMCLFITLLFQNTNAVLISACVFLGFGIFGAVWTLYKYWQDAEYKERIEAFFLGIPLILSVGLVVFFLAGLFLYIGYFGDILSTGSSNWKIMLATVAMFTTAICCGVGTTFTYSHDEGWMTYFKELFKWLFGTIFMVGLVVMMYVFLHAINPIQTKPLSVRQSLTAWAVVGFIISLALLFFVLAPPKAAVQYRDDMMPMLKLFGYIAMLIIFYRWVPRSFISAQPVNNSNGDIAMVNETVPTTFTSKLTSGSTAITIFIRWIVALVPFVIGIYLFYKASDSGAVLDIAAAKTNANLYAKRSKLLLVFYCSIVFAMIYFYTYRGTVNTSSNVNPTDGTTTTTEVYSASRFSKTWPVLIAFMCIVFVYLFLVMNIKVRGAASSPTGLDAYFLPSDNGTNVGESFFQGLSPVSLIFEIFLFVLVVAIAIVLGVTNVVNGGAAQEATKDGSLSITCMSAILIGFFFVFYFLYLMTSTIKDTNLVNFETPISKIAGTSLVAMEGLVFVAMLGCLIAWIVYVSNIPATSRGYLNIFINIIVMFFVAALMFRVVAGGAYYQNNALYRLIINFFFYIPCFFVNLLHWFSKRLPGLPSGMVGVGESLIGSGPPFYPMLVGIIVLYILYYVLYPFLRKKYVLQGGLLLLNNPVSLGTQVGLGPIGTTLEPNYNYGISFWLTLDASADNNKSQDAATILNFGGLPLIQYNGPTGKLIVHSTNIVGTTGGVYPSCEIVLPLQKWNNVIVSYNDGYLDVFFNGDLVYSNKTSPSVPKGEITIGDSSGLLNGSICNLTYFAYPLSIKQIYYLYNSVKDVTPPVPEPSMKVSTTKGDVPVGGEEHNFISNITNKLVTVTKNVGANILNETVATPLTNTVGSKYMSIEWYIKSLGGFAD